MNKFEVFFGEFIYHNIRQVEFIKQEKRCFYSTEEKTALNTWQIRIDADGVFKSYVMPRRGRLRIKLKDKLICDGDFVVVEGNKFSILFHMCDELEVWRQDEQF